MGVRLREMLRARLRIVSALATGDVQGAVVLNYHSLDSTGRPYSTDPEVFRRQMDTIASAQLPVVPLGDITSRSGVVALTFDDGFRSFLDHGLPVLQRLGFPATMFTVTGHLDQTHHRGFDGGWRPAGELLDSDGLRHLASAGVEIGAHSVNHRDLVRLTPNEVRSEMRDSRSRIEDLTGRRVTSFAYPFGSWNPWVRDIAAEEFSQACGVGLAFVQADSDRLALPRIDSGHLCHMLSAEALRCVTRRAWLRVVRAFTE